MKLAGQHRQDRIVPELVVVDEKQGATKKAPRRRGSWLGGLGRVDGVDAGASGDPGDNLLGDFRP